VQSTGRFLPTRKLLPLVWNATHAIPNPRLCVRLHPADRMPESDRHRWVAQGICFADKGCLYDWLAQVDLVITQASSTLGLEALFFNKPLVIVNLSPRRDLIPYVPRQVAAGVYHADELGPVICAALARPPHTEEARREFIWQFAHALDGQSSRRTADLIARLARGGGNAGPHSPVPG
jgi:CDP-glycerol glycerophosphotransferase (TagB/SpsB family)